MWNILQEGNKRPVIEGENAVLVKKIRVAEVRGTGGVESVAAEREGGSACCSELPIWHPLSQHGMMPLPSWTTMPKDSPNQPPTRIYKTASKEIDRPRSQDNTPGG